MSQEYEKLKSLLKELFQLDQPDLDFGLYRIMHAKAGEVTQFLDRTCCRNTWKVRLIEEDFHRLMFDTENV